MALWKTLVTMLLAAICLGLALATIVVPITIQGDERWYWLAGLLVGTVIMGTLFALFLKAQDRNFGK